MPQVIKTGKTKHVKDLSLGSLTLLFLGTSLWCWYGLTISDRSVWLTNGVIAALALILCVFKLAYEKPSGELLELNTFDAAQRDLLVMSACQWLADKQYVGEKLFSYLVKVQPNVAKELVTVVRKKGVWYVHLIQRPANDPDFPGSPWYCPGKVVAKGVRHLEVVKKLTQSDESGMNGGRLVFAGVREFPREQRGAGKIILGHWFCLIFVRVLDQVPTTGTYPGEFFSTLELPGINVIPSHRDGLLPAVLEFLDTGKPTFAEALS